MQSQRQITYQWASPLYADLPDPNPCLLGIIRAWAQTRGQDLPGSWEMTRPDERFAQFCADAHQHAQHAPLESRTLESYGALNTVVANDAIGLMSIILQHLRQNATPGV